ncbi:uncharacterized protein LOC131166594 [Malania oleifera]|uniref:uncharacterized protein LOC131166594 n=1 Tax=Malania oleifera TaxID=397392 RepID=UPI0025AE5A13|nr:uncharacterized protein LOC131166594 [Malania oleifera]
MMRWSVELGEFDVHYKPKPASKAWVLADFMVEQSYETTEEPKVWTLHVDGSSNAIGGGAGLILTALDGLETLYAPRLEFTTTNNDAEYEARLASLRLVESLRVARIHVSSDLQLVVEQVKGEFEAKEQKMKKYLAKAQKYIKTFAQFDIEHVPRSENGKADTLARLASATKLDWKSSVYLGGVGKPSYEEVSMNLVVVEANEGEWRTPLIQYLLDGSLSNDKKQSMKIRRRATRYTLINQELYRSSLTLPYLCCLGAEEGEYVLKEIHERICGNHLASRALAHKALRQGFYLPTMKKDALEMVKRCNRCQRCAGIPRMPASILSPLTSPCPFAQWGLDILEPLP